MKNMELRTSREIDKARKFANDRLLKELLPVMDSLVRGLGDSDSDDPKVQSIREGMMLTMDLFTKTLNRFGVVVIDPAVGEDFNPEQHEAMSVMSHPKAKPNTIIEVLQKGYCLNGRVIKAAMVIVAKD